MFIFSNDNVLGPYWTETQEATTTEVETQEATTTEVETQEAASVADDQQTVPQIEDEESDHEEVEESDLQPDADHAFIDALPEFAVGLSGMPLFEAMQSYHKEQYSNFIRPWLKKGNKLNRRRPNALSLEAQYFEETSEMQDASERRRRQREADEAERTQRRVRYAVHQEREAQSRDNSEQDFKSG